MTDVVCEWGLEGIELYRPNAAAFIIVDVLSFTTAVSVALDAGATIIPFPWGDADAAAVEARRRSAIAAAPKRTTGGQLSLSPASLRRLSRDERVLLPSPNGARLSLATGDVPTFCASLRNFEAVASAARATAGAGAVAVIPAGERWPDGSLRPALEDWLGAGAVISALSGRPNSEARAARLMFDAAGANLSALVRESRSGRELLDRGFDIDVEIALELSASRTAPRLVEGEYVDDLA